MPADVQRESLSPIFTRIEWVTETASTNSDLLEAAAGRRAFGGQQLTERQAGAEAGGHGSVLVAEYQRSGRGRGGRSWVAPRGSALLMSVLLRPIGWQAVRVALLTQAMAISALEACRSLGAEVDIKWPNDLVGRLDETSAKRERSARRQGGAGSAEMKLAGVLAETAPLALTGHERGGEPRRAATPTVVVGLGVNLRWSKELERAVTEEEDSGAERDPGERAFQRAGKEREFYGSQRAEGDPGERAFQPLPPVSLDRLAGKSVERHEFLIRVLANFDRWYRCLDREAAGAETLVRKLGSCCITLGRPVSVSTPGGVVEGTAVGLTESGHLILETGRGTDKGVTAELATVSAELATKGERDGRVVISAGDCIHLR